VHLASGLAGEYLGAVLGTEVKVGAGRLVNLRLTIGDDIGSATASVESGR